MKKATILAISLISVSLLGAPLAQAEDATAYPVKAMSDATVTLTDDDGGSEGEKPVGPGGGENGGEDGELKPIEPGGNGGGEDGGIVNPGQTSPLRLSLLTAFNFGTIKMSGNTETYLANLPTPNFEEGGKQARPNFIQVTDNRGNHEGWKVTAKIATQFTYQDSVLTGSEIKLMNAWSHAQASDNKEFAPEVAQSVTLQEGIESPIATAQEGFGMGTWNVLYGTLYAPDKAQLGDATSSVTLTIPGKVQKKAGTYKAAIQWTLANTPKD